MSYSAIHKAADLTVSWLCLVLFHCSIIPLKNVPLGVNGSRWQEQPPETVLYGSRQSGGFVNSTVSYQPFTVSWLCLVLFHCSIIPLKNVPLGVNGSRRQERPPETVLYGGRQSGSFVNSTVSYQPFPKIPVAGTTPRGHSPINGFMDGMVEQWNSTRTGGG